MAGFQDLVVWQRSIELAKCVYLLTKKLPKDELYGLVSQSRRSAVSVASNIAEGHGRGSSKDFGRFLGIALGSLRELQTQLIIVRELEYANPKAELDQCEEVARMIHGLVASLGGSK
jgi:four helix bundle protein